MKKDCVVREMKKFLKFQALLNRLFKTYEIT